MIQVKDAIKILQGMDPEAFLVKSSDNFELNGAIVNVELIREDNMVVKEETFRDAFDYQMYQKNVYKSNFNNEKNTVKCVRFY